MFLLTKGKTQSKICMLLIRVPVYKVIRQCFLSEGSESRGLSVHVTLGLRVNLSWS